ncbi:DNA fragmentation factor subunit beta-like [Ostrinia furnacalis]|uniref:DNA fragmentation factor subunit beta-like n=1 Tax=Ostrinia furnacalis TaxID=93504 RepID=UPI001038C619|nr:DNA fragmentation factor subunit beta-like [Ostrinia furnacalis]
MFKGSAGYLFTHYYFAWPIPILFGVGPPRHASPGGSVLGCFTVNFLLTNLKLFELSTFLKRNIFQSPILSGLEPSEKTKEQSMSKRVKERMKGYYYKTKSALQASELYINTKSGRGKRLIDQFLVDLRKILESNKYNESYFNRKADQHARICNDSGLFECGGLWSKDTCSYEGDHVINPYRSREERIIFQTWNLDHKIELSRSIIPNILKAIEGLYNGDIKCITCEAAFKQGTVEADRYYIEIFTRENLKLVHIVCHYKGRHDANSDVYTVCKKCIRAQSIEYNA